MTAYAAWHDRPADPDEASDESTLEPDRTGERPDVDWDALMPTVVLMLHVYVGDEETSLARVEGHGPVTETWLRRHLGPRARFVVRPVLDIAGQAPVDAYEIPDRHRRAVQPSRAQQIDHAVPFRHGADRPAGQSRVGNYGPMTQFHHRVKTHGAWQVQQPFPGIYVWRDPDGALYLVDHTGTRHCPAGQVRLSQTSGVTTPVAGSPCVRWYAATARAVRLSTTPSMRTGRPRAAVSVRWSRSTAAPVSPTLRSGRPPRASSAVQVPRVRRPVSGRSSRRCALPTAAAVRASYRPVIGAFVRCWRRSRHCAARTASPLRPMRSVG